MLTAAQHAGVRLPAPPARLSQDSNILSRNLTDRAGRLRYIPHVRVEPCLACLGALVLHVAERIAGVVPLVVLVLLLTGRFRGGHRPAPAGACLGARGVGSSRDRGTPLVCRTSTSPQTLHTQETHHARYILDQV